jgi:ribosomal protein L11 methylase PrmA
MSAAAAVLEPGSFRDPGGRVFESGRAILRAIMPSAADSFAKVSEAGVLRRLADQGRLVDFTDVSAENSLGATEASIVLQHPRIPFISYPYEWSFGLHRAAALFHLDLQISLLKDGFALSDATAYNVQFQGPNPIFIDHLSVRPYVEGEIWAGHRQFCMQFLNPLLMWSLLDVQPNHWFRGNLEGIAPEDLAKLLPMRSKLSWTVLTHVVAQAAMQTRTVKASKPTATPHTAKLSRQGFEGILRGLRSKIAKLAPPSHHTVWGDYAGRNSYGSQEAEDKARFVKEMVAAVRPQLMYDIGCNSGDYSVAALDAGAEKVIGFDFDHAALEIAYDRACKQKLDFLPVWLDAANPSPAQGWNQAERKGLTGRADAQALVALAFIHHIAIGRNVPLDMATDWLVGLAPAGVIEFPHKSDPMVQTLLAQREDIFPNYEKHVFEKLLGERARIVKAVDVLPTRTLYWYDRG